MFPGILMVYCRKIRSPRRESIEASAKTVDVSVDSRASYSSCCRCFRSSDRWRNSSGLIQVLLDFEAEFGDRQDAAMDLAAFDDETVEQALVSVACDKNSDDDLANSCGEFLAKIWCRKNLVNQQVLTELAPASLRIALATLQSCSPVLAAQGESLL